MSGLATDRSFGWEGWVLVVAIVFAFIVIPGIILFRPPTDVSFRFAYLILPTIPAIGLALVAVWVAMRRD